MASVTISSKHITDEDYKRSLIGRALVPFYSGEAGETLAAEVSCVAMHVPTVATLAHPSPRLPPAAKRHPAPS